MMSPQNDDARKRKSGLLLHITSLPSPYGIGDFGDGAYRFVDFLEQSRQGFWQILPLNPTAPILGNSPYSSISTFAGNPILISPDFLVRDGLLAKSDVDGHPSFLGDCVDYQAVTNYKNHILKKAYEKNESAISANKDFLKFCQKNENWLEDYSLFVALKDEFNGVVWGDWPSELKTRDKTALKEYSKKLESRMTYEKFVQFVFFKQWGDLKNYANAKNIKIIGDIPIYVSYDSVDVWANPGIFKLDKNLKPISVAGVPPDYFSQTGQLWGNPVYYWAALRQQKYRWWFDRVAHSLSMMDVIRFDHFRGFVGFWEVAVTEKTAVNGKWVKAPAGDFFTKLLKKFPQLPVIAEDLGMITDDVRSIMARFGFPGMKLLLFAFDDTPAKNPYIPHNLLRNSVIYTGTHDNNTVRGWFEKEARPEDRIRVLRYLGHEIPSRDIAWELVRLAMMSVSDTAIFPLQDILGLPQEARMNRPATVGQNWQWRVLPDALSVDVCSRLKELTETYARA